MRFPGNSASLQRCAWVPCVLGLLLFSGCRTYDQQVCDIRGAYYAGRYSDAAALAEEQRKSASGGRDELIWTLETATLSQSAGHFEDSQRLFADADRIYGDYAQQAKIKVGAEGLSLFTNPAKLPYRGRAYDGIMINVYQALDALQKGDRETARVYINKTYDRQQAAVAEYAAKIEKEGAAPSVDANVTRTLQDPSFTNALSGLDTPVEGLAAYADYVNPFAVYLDGLYHWNAGVDDSDKQRAQKCFERVLAFAPNNPYVREDFDRAMKAKASDPSGEPVCYILFETGAAPSRDAVRIDVPILVTRVSYVGISFPRLRMHDIFVKSLLVESGGLRWETSRVANMDAVIAKDFQNELPSIIAHATASAVAKAAAAYALNTAANEAGGRNAQLISQLLTAGYQFAMNVADTRTWNTLPKEFQVCKVPIPADRRITLTAPEYGWRQDVTLGTGSVVVVWAKAVEQPNQMAVSQFTLK